MNLNFHIAVFARAPVAGHSKTRLIPLLGAEGAAAAHSEMIFKTLSTACAAAPGRVSLWSAGDHDHPFLEECSERFKVTRHRQVEGDLGERMSDCLCNLLRSDDIVLLIGTDCPALRTEHLQAAAASLWRGARLVFTPAEDGGYVLVGARPGPKPGGLERSAGAAAQPAPNASVNTAPGDAPATSPVPIPDVRPDSLPDATLAAALAAVFRDIPWSSDRVMALTRSRLAALGWTAPEDWAEQPMLWDVDTPADMERAVRAGFLQGQV